MKEELPKRGSAANRAILALWLTLVLLCACNGA